MILRDSLFWRNVTEHSFLLIIVSAHSLASLTFLLQTSFSTQSCTRKEVFQQTVSSARRWDRFPWTSARFRRTWIGRLRRLARGAMRRRPGCACHGGRRKPPARHFPGAANSREFRPGESAPSRRCERYRIPTARERPRKALWDRGREGLAPRAGLFRYLPW